MSCRLPLDLFAMIGEDAVGQNRSMNEIVKNIVKEHYESLGRKPNDVSLVWMMNERNKNLQKRENEKKSKTSFVRRLFGIE